mgnify:CR=1 FL=1|eukprot:scaffold151957_cov33-Tisochrysis_lutea.AAC.1
MIGAPPRVLCFRDARMLRVLKAGCASVCSESLPAPEGGSNERRHGGPAGVATAKRSSFGDSAAWRNSDVVKAEERYTSNAVRRDKRTYRMNELGASAMTIGAHKGSSEHEVAKKWERSGRYRDPIVNQINGEEAS